MAKTKKYSVPYFPNADEIAAVAAGIRTDGFDDGEKYPPIQRRYIEASELTPRPLPDGDCMVYTITVRTNKPLDMRELNEALFRGFAEGYKTHNARHSTSSAYRCAKCSAIAGYSITVSVKPCPACAGRKRRADKKRETGLP